MVSPIAYLCNVQVLLPFPFAKAVTFRNMVDMGLRVYILVGL